jgi:subtilase family serine protease
MRSWRSILAIGTIGALAMAAAAPAAPAAARPPGITFYFGLKRPEARAVAAFFAVQQPGSPTYRRFGTLAQISARYGASPATRRAFLAQIRRLGLGASIDRSGVFARVTGTVRRFERAFGVRITSLFNNDTISISYGTAGNRPLRLPRALRPLVQDVVPNYARSSRFPTARTAATSTPRATASGPKNAGTWIDGCAKARALGAYSFAQVRDAYGIGALGSGQGASVAIMNVDEGLTAQDIAQNGRCFGYGPLRTRTLLTDGQAHPFGRGSFEPQEDLALVRGAAPGLSSLIFTQAWGIPSLWFLGASQVLAAHSLPDALSISYGECERAIRGPRAGQASRAGANLLDSVLVRLGLAGVSAFASAGDFGTSCDGEQFKGIAWPGSSPYLSSVGGTRLVLNRANQRVNEVVWNDLRWASPLNGGGASGGGLSGVSPRPPFQDGLPVPGTRRAVPDVSAHASMFPGWPVVLAGNWVLDGGTSASTPLIAAAFAILSADQRAARRPPLGPVDGLLYALRRAAPSTIYDVVSGSNGYDRKIPGYNARPGYDLASGLGVPQFAQLARALPAPAG